MKKSTETVLDQEKTNPILLKAWELMRLYARATGAQFCVHDRNCMPIPELLEKLLSEKNICLFCIKYKKHLEAKERLDLSANPCKEIHIKAMKESHRFGGSYTYVCELGFIFWTSPIYVTGHFAGALIGSGFLETDIEETCRRVHSVYEKALGEIGINNPAANADIESDGVLNPSTRIKQLLRRFPRGESRKIKALAELMFICAQSLSVGSEGCHTTMKRRLEQQSDLAAKIDEMKKQYSPGSPKPEYPLDKEQSLIEALRRGDEKSGKKILNEILAFLFFANPDQFRHIQYRAIELAVLLSRTDTGSGFAARTILATANQYITIIEEAKNIEELTDALYRIFDETAGQIRSFHGIHHAAALKKAEYYILENFTRKISLEEIAGTSGFSAPYFSTIFKEGMGENLSGYLNRLRVEKAAYMLTDTNSSLGKIAQACGFEDQSWFSKIFKLYTGMSPGKYRNQGGKSESKIPETVFSDEYRLLIEK